MKYVEKDFHFAERKIMETWIKTSVHKQVWKVMAGSDGYAGYDWTVKVAPNAVLFPAKSVQRSDLMPVPPNGAF